MAWLTDVRRAVVSYILGDPPRAGSAGAPDLLSDASGPFAATQVGRIVTVQSAGQPQNVGKYRIQQVISSSTAQLSPAWPSASGAVTYILESAIEAYRRARSGNIFSYEVKQRIPQRLALADLPALEIMPSGYDIEQWSSHEIELRLSIRINVASAGPSPDAVEEMVGLIADRLMRGRQERFGFDESAAGVFLGGMTLGRDDFGHRELTAGEDSATVVGTYWFCALHFTAGVRRALQTSA